MNRPERKIGDMVWWARCETRGVRKPCIVCYGKLEVVLILGNGEQVNLPCDYCGKGYEGPKGYTDEYEYIAKPELVKMDSIQSNQTCEGTKNEYRYGNYILNDDIIFDSKEDAEEKCKEIAAKYEKDLVTETEHIKANVNKSFSWNAGYHMKNIKDLQRQIGYHESRMIACKQRVKEPS